MSGVATAIAASAVIGGISSNKASKRASETAQQTSDEQLAYMRDAENRARADIETLFPQATDVRNRSTQQAMDFYSSALPMTIEALQGGNIGAQQVLAGSLPQMQSAILGGPVDYSFAQPQRLDVDIAGLLSGLPDVWQPPVVDSPQQVTPPNVGVPQYQWLSGGNDISRLLSGSFGGNNQRGYLANYKVR